MQKVGGVHHSNCDTDDELLSAYLYLYLYLMSCECILRRVVSVDLCWGIRVSLWVRGASQQLRSPQPYPQPSTTNPHQLTTLSLLQHSNRFLLWTAPKATAKPILSLPIMKSITATYLFLFLKCILLSLIRSKRQLSQQFCNQLQH